MDQNRFTRIVAVAAIIAALSPASAIAADNPAAPVGQTQSQSQTTQAGDASGAQSAAPDASSSAIPDGATVTVEYQGKPVALTRNAQGVWEGSATAGSDRDLAAKLSASWSKDGQSGTVDLKPDRSKVFTTVNRLGVTSVGGSAQYTSDQVSFTLTCSYEEGTEAKAGWETGKETASFTKNADGSWTAALPTDGLHTDNSPYHDSVSVGGQSLKAEWSDAKISTNDKGTVVWTRTMSADGEIDGQKVHVTGEAIRLHDMHVGLSVTRTDASGTQTRIDVPGTQATDPSQLKDDYTVDAQSWQHVSDSYTLTGEAGPDATLDKPSYGLGDGAERVATQKIEWTDASGVRQSKTVRVHVPFQYSQEEPETGAELEGIYVNRSGQKTKGDLIDGWNPRVHRYAIQIGENDPSPYILPVGGDKVTVKAGDVLQTAYTSTQVWNVNVKQGDASSSYQVTVIRAHSTPTADEAFTPGDAKPETPSKEPDSPADTKLVSWGWRGSDGVYHAESSDTYQIPEGGVIAWEAKIGQTVTNSVEKTAPMRYTHDLGVLAADGSTFRIQELHVTYITADTHKAELTGLTANGEKVAGFAPDVTSYTVHVDDPSSWTLVPSYDKRLGMSIATHRDGANATVKVTSADGMVSRTYLVHADKRGSLPQTGTMGLAPLAVALSSALAAMAGLAAARRRKA